MFYAQSSLVRLNVNSRVSDKCATSRSVQVANGSAGTVAKRSSSQSPTLPLRGAVPLSLPQGNLDFLW